MSTDKSKEHIKRPFRAGLKSFKYLKRQRRYLLVVAAILFVFGLLNYSKISVKGEQASIAEAVLPNDIVEETSSNDDGILGGSWMSAIIPAAQADIDFSADDEQENRDYAMMEGSGITTQNNSNPDPFFGLRREVTTYVVAQGDTPSDIAVKFDINTDTLLWANGLRDGDLIRPGDKLLILPINGVRIKVVAKDTVASLAKKYNGKAEEVNIYNGLSDGKLIAGSYLIIPNGEMAAPLASAKKNLPPSKISSSPSAGNWLILPTTGRDWGRIHGQNGADIANVCGTAIYAAAAGRVILADSAGWNDGYGKYIMIRHPNGVVTVYAHTSKILVDLGDQVGQGQLIALMGTTGRSTGCHLHFEVRGARNPLAGAKTVR